MTNEEIERRFLFDLEIGMFKTDTQNKDIVVFKCYEDHYLKLLFILRRLNFSLELKNNNYVDYYKIYIDTHRKIIYLKNTSVPDYSYAGIYNIVPFYIDNYCDNIK